MSATPTTQIDRQNDVVIITVKTHDLDENNMRQVMADVAGAAASAGSLPFILDLASVKFVPSLTLGALVRLANDFRSRRQRLILASLQPQIRKVITLTRLDRLFDLHDDVASALKTIRV